MGNSLLEQDFKGYQNIFEQCVEQTRLKLWLSFLKRTPDKRIYHKALDIAEGMWKKRQAFPIWMWLSALIYLLSLRRKRKKKAKSESWVMMPQARVVLFSPGFLRLSILLVGETCIQFIRITVSCGNETEQAAEECVLGFFQVCPLQSFVLSGFDVAKPLARAPVFQHLGLSSVERAKSWRRAHALQFARDL